MSLMVAVVTLVVVVVSVRLERAHRHENRRMSEEANEMTSRREWPQTIQISNSNCEMADEQWGQSAALDCRFLDTDRSS